MIKQSDLFNIGRWLSKKFVDELDHQGHISSSSPLAKSIQPKISTDGLNQIIGIEMNAYAVYVNEGVQGSRVRTPIDVLVKWVEKRLGKRGKEARSIAFAIRATQQKEGMPTIGSKRFSKNGRRTGFIEDALDINDAELTVRVSKLAEDAVIGQIDNMIKDFKR